MKATVAAVFTIVLFASSAIADKPKTVDEAVQVLKTKWLQPKDRDWILRNPKDVVWSGLYIRDRMFPKHAEDRVYEAG